MNNPKQLLFLLLCFVTIVFTVTSCYKPHHYPLPNPNPERTIQYELFTESADVSKDNHDIIFSLFIEKANGGPIWDSSLATMKIKDIPFLPNKLVAQKIISDTGLLRIGFRYIIVDIGTSGLVDTIHANATFKNVSLNFR